MDLGEKLDLDWIKLLLYAVEADVEYVAGKGLWKVRYGLAERIVVIRGAEEEAAPAGRGIEAAWV